MTDQVAQARAAFMFASEAWSELPDETLERIGLDPAERDSGWGPVWRLDILEGDRYRVRFAPVGFYEAAEARPTYPLVVRLDPDGWVLESVNFHSHTEMPIGNIEIPQPPEARA